MIKNLIFIALVMFMVFSQAQDQHSIDQKSLDCRNDLDEEKALSDYLDYISRINGINKHSLNSMREILKGFIDYRRASIEAENGNGKAREEAERKKKEEAERKKKEEAERKKKEEAERKKKEEAERKKKEEAERKKKEEAERKKKEEAERKKKEEAERKKKEEAERKKKEEAERKKKEEAERKKKEEAERKKKEEEEAKAKKGSSFEKEQRELKSKEYAESQTYQGKLKEYYQVESQIKQKEEKLRKAREPDYTIQSELNILRAQESSLRSEIFTTVSRFTRGKGDHYNKLAEYEILESYEQAAAKIKQAMKPIEAPEKDSMRVENGVTVFKVTEKISGEAERHRLRQQFTASDFTPTGFYLSPNTNLKVSVKLEKGHHLPKLLVDTYGRRGYYCSSRDKDGCKQENMKPENFAREKTLKEGENIVSDPHGGLLYIRYVDDRPSDSEASVSFLEGMKPVPFFRLGKTTHEEWLKMLQEDKYKESPDVILEGERAIIVVSRDKAIEYKDEDQEVVLGTADNIVRFQDEFSGLDGSSDKHKPNIHKYLMTESSRDTSAGIAADAVTYRTAYYNKNVDDIITQNGLIINGLTPWHEIGHMHQQSEWKWNSVSEIGANLYAWITEKKMGNPDDYDPEYYRRLSEYFRLPIDQRDFNLGGRSGGSGHSQYGLNDIRLSFFKLLYKAYGEGFYKKLHQYVREHPDKDLDIPFGKDKEKMEYFMVAACHVSNNNLYRVFQAWGLLNAKNSATIYGQISRYPEPEERIKKILIPDVGDIDPNLKYNVDVQLDKEGIKMKINTDFIGNREVKLRFIIKELDIDNFYIGSCEFEGIIEGKKGEQRFKYPFREKCTGYHRIDRGEGLTDRKMQLEVLMDNQRDLLYKTDFTILNFD